MQRKLRRLIMVLCRKKKVHPSSTEMTMLADTVTLPTYMRKMNMGESYLPCQGLLSFLSGSLSEQLTLMSKVDIGLRAVCDPNPKYLL